MKERETEACSLSATSEVPAMNSTAIILLVVRWTARFLALALFLCWGAFFVEHLQEWFLHPAQGFPPAWVWLAMLAHLSVLLGMLALWKWEVAGSLLAIAGALTFFGGLALREMLAGHRYVTLLIFLAVTLLAPVLTLLGHFARGHFLSVPAPPVNA
jgi:hypothetical protein